MTSAMTNVEEPAGRPRSSGARPTDDQLCAGVRSVFLERGFEAATMGELARAADTTRPTLYAHFGDKAAVFRAVVLREARLYEDAVASVYQTFDQLDIEAAVDAGIAASFDFAAAHPDTIRLLLLSERLRVGVMEDLEATLTARLAEACQDWCGEHALEMDPAVLETGCAVVIVTSREALRRSRPFGQEDPDVVRAVVLSMTRATFMGLVTDFAAPVQP